MNSSKNSMGLDPFADGFDSGEDSAQLDIQHYLRVLRKHKWFIVFFTSVVTVLAAYYASTLTPVYRAASTLLIEQQRANVVSIEELYGIDSESSDYYQTQFELLKSRRLAVKMIDGLGLWNDPELSPRAATLERQKLAETQDTGGGIEGVLERIKSQVLGGPVSEKGDEEEAVSILVVPEQNENAVDTDLFESSQPVLSPENAVDLSVDDDLNFTLSPDQKAVVGRFMARFGVTPIRKTKLVQLSFESTDPVKATKIANYAGEAYIADYLDSKLELTTKASEWLNQRLETLQLTLDASEQRLIDFKKANGLVDVGGSVGRLNEQELLLLTEELADARSDLSAAANVNREIRAASESPELLEAIPVVQGNALVQNLKVEQGVAQRQLDELLNRYGVKHPRVVDARSALTTLESTLRQTVSRVVSAINKNYELQQQRVRNIEAKLAEGKQEIQVIGTKKFELDSLERELRTNQNIYDTFFNRMTEAKSADGLETANARISDYASVPGFPIKPNKQMIVIAALLGSLIVTMLMAFLYEQMDRSVKSTNDIEDKLGLRLLGILPLIKTGAFKTKNSLPLNPLEIKDPKGTFFEAVDTARTALCINPNNEESGKIILVTSSVPGEGKSTSSINLAYSLGQMEKVLLIDCDMRRPTIAKAAGMEKNTPGLANLIMQTAGANECIKRGVFGGRVDVIPSGPIPKQPLELLSSKRFEKLLLELCKYYDRIVIDCAPTQAVSDALVLGNLSDTVVYVVKSHDTTLELVKRGVQRLTGSGCPTPSILMTQVDVDKLASYGGDYYYQGYYDYYGYKEHDKKSANKKINLTPADLRKLINDDDDVVLDIDGIEKISSTFEDTRSETLKIDSAELKSKGSRAARKTTSNKNTPKLDIL